MKINEIHEKVKVLSASIHTHTQTHMYTLDWRIFQKRG